MKQKITWNGTGYTINGMLGDTKVAGISIVGKNVTGYLFAKKVYKGFLVAEAKQAIEYRVRIRTKMNYKDNMILALLIILILLGIIHNVLTDVNAKKLKQRNADLQECIIRTNAKLERMEARYRDNEREITGLAEVVKRNGEKIELVRINGESK